MQKTASVINHVKDKDGQYVATFPINTVEEVYYDVDKGIKLKDVMKHVVQYTQVTTEAELYHLTSDMVTVGTVVKVVETSKTYRVIDTTKLNVPEGYEDITLEKGPVQQNGVTLVTYSTDNE